MLPPIPASVVPVTPQQDAVKPRPDIPPVTPAQASANESEVALDKRHPQEAAERLADEQRRRQRERRSEPHAGDEAEGTAADGETDPEEGQERPRLGSHVDISV